MNKEIFIEDGELDTIIGDPPRTERTEVELLKAKIASLEAREGKLKTPYASGKEIDHTSFYDGQHLLVGFVSDTQMSSRLARHNELDTAYKLFQQEGVTKVYHCGDMVAGVGVYRGQENELTNYTYEDQKNDVIRNYPKDDKIKTYWITGNHDLSFLKAVGADIGIAINRERKDLVYLGQIEADIKLARKVMLRLRHPAGGSTYAISYPTQRYIASLEGGRKPNILAQGHFHTAFYMDHRNIHVLQVPCFEYQTLYEKAKGLQPTCGFWLVEMHIKDGSINRFKPELIKYF